MRAHAPGSVTGLFAPAPDDEESRSRGASFATEAGVVVDLTPAPETELTVDGEPAPFEPIDELLGELDVTAAVDVQPEVPLGAGFGASGAATLATALAANAAFDLGFDREELVAASHRAERAADTGQGDVYIQDAGGLIWSANGELHRVEPDGFVEYVSGGSISTAEMLADEAFMETATRCGRRQLDALSAPPTLRELAERSRSYAIETGIETEFVRREADRVEAAGGVAGMALFGETVFAVGVEGILSNRTAVSATGVRLLGE